MLLVCHYNVFIQVFHIDLYKNHEGEDLCVYAEMSIWNICF